MRTRFHGLLATSVEGYVDPAESPTAREDDVPLIRKGVHLQPHESVSRELGEKHDPWFLAFGEALTS